MQQKPIRPQRIKHEQVKQIMEQHPHLPTENAWTVMQRQMRLHLIVDKLHDHSTTKKSNKIFFKDEIFQQGDFVFVENFHSHSPRLVCRIKKFYQVSESIEGVPIVELEWCLQKSDLIDLQFASQLISIAEIFPSNRRVCQFVTAIKSKVTVLTIEEYVQVQSSKEGFFFTRANFDTIKQQFNPSISYWKRICFCQSIPRIDENKGRFIVCDECQSIFHQKCFYLCETFEVQSCKSCETRRLSTQMELIKIEDERSVSQ